MSSVSREIVDQRLAAFSYFAKINGPASLGEEQ